MRFRNQYRFLSNFYPSKIRFKGRVFPSAEHMYQAAKTQDKGEQDRLIAHPSKGLKAAARKVTLRPDWEEKKVPFMRDILRLKFSQHPDLLAKLKSIPGEIKEDNTWNDTFWGVCNGKGKNMLGKLLMEIRDTLS